jgi:hypothetical protein
MTASIDGNYLFQFILYLVILIGIIVVFYMLIQITFGEQYTYNMSESEIRDEWVTQACMKLSINSPACDFVYGGILDKPSEGRIK